MKCKTCHYPGCTAPLTRSNSQKYCTPEHRTAHYRETGRAREVQKRFNRKKYNAPGPGKIKCPYCAGHYKALMHHVWQVHEETAREFKMKHGLPLGASVITSELKAIKREAVTPEIIQKNLIDGGKQTRYKRGHGAIATAAMFALRRGDITIKEAEDILERLLRQGTSQ